MFHSRKPSPTLPRQSDKQTIIVPLGLLHEHLNHNATGAAFLRLAKEDNRLEEGAQLDFPQLLKLMPNILNVDERFKIGELDEKTFREEIKKILKFKNLDDNEFDHAWNAMQGDLEKFKRTLEEIKGQNPNTHIILISQTNPIHIRNIYRTVEPETNLTEQKEAPLSLLGMPLYVSYQCQNYRIEFVIALYNEAYQKQNLSAITTSIVIQSTSNSQLAKLRDEEVARKVKEWAETKGVNVIEHQAQSKIQETISQGLSKRTLPQPEIIEEKKRGFGMGM